MSIRECAKAGDRRDRRSSVRGWNFAPIVASFERLFASENASVGLPEVTVGLMGGCRHAMQLFGRSKVRRLILVAGDRVDGRELLRLGGLEIACPPSGVPTANAT